ncbi:MAG: sugar phosphate isomerase/epimerase [Planctomycetota bacterium]|nr:sugar phosphate isomerase/epimerase [Planctomycetota bacterium]
MTLPKKARPANEPFGYCLNLSTIRGQNLPITEDIDIAAAAGFTAIEPWLNKLDEYVKGGGSLKDLRKRIADHGMTVESGIGFAEWIVDDDQRRAKGLEQSKSDMDVLLQIGGKRIAAPPAGAVDVANLNLLKAAERYRALAELGQSMGIKPQVEVWGFSQSLSRLGETTFVAIESGLPNACILADVYHLYKGGSDFSGLSLLNGNAMEVFHVNDYPADPVRAKITDADRVYPGDGVAPLATIYRQLRDIGFTGYLSLELFNPGYWKQDAKVVAKTGLEKLRHSVQQALA